VTSPAAAAPNAAAVPAAPAAASTADPVVAAPPVELPKTTSTPAAPVKPDALDAAYWDDKTGIKADMVAADLAALKTFKAEADIRAQGVPEKPDGYKIDLDGWTAPEGVQVTIDEKHPLAAPVKDWAHKYGIHQEAISALVKVQADYVANEAKAWNDTKATEVAKLGAKAQERVDAVTTAIIGRLGEKGKPLLGLMVSAGVVEAFESMLRTTAAPGPSAQNGRGSAQPDLSKASAGQKFAYFLGANAQGKQQ